MTACGAHLGQFSASTSNILPDSSGLIKGESSSDDAAQAAIEHHLATSEDLYI